MSLDIWFPLKDAFFAFMTANSGKNISSCSILLDDPQKSSTGTGNGWLGNGWLGL